MAAGALAEKITQVVEYRERVPDARPPIPVSAADMRELSALLRDIESLLSAADTHALPDTPEMQGVVEYARELGPGVAHALAVAGIDATWGMIGADREGHPIYNAIVLSPEDSAMLGAMLENPPELSDYLKSAIDEYKVLMGR